MNRIDLLKKLLPGFIPLFAFIAIDEIWGTTAGLVAALAIGVAELVWIGYKEKRFDKFVLPPCWLFWVAFPFFLKTIFFSS